MICVTDCSECRHRLPLKDGWLACCEAFPDGIPLNFDFSNLKERKVCNPENGMGFNPIEENNSETAPK